MHSIEWYRAVFDYPDAEVEFWQKMAAQVAGPIAVIPVGIGDPLLGMAYARAHFMGFDSDSRTLAYVIVRIAREATPAAMGRITLGFGRLEHCPPTVRESVAAVFIPRNGWWCLMSAVLRRQALVAAHARLRPRGLLVIDGFHVTDTERAKASTIAKMPYYATTRISTLSNVVSCSIRRAVTWSHDRTVRSERFYADWRSGDRPAHDHLGTINLACLSYAQMAAEINDPQLFEVEGLYGHWDRRPFDPDATASRQIWVLRKK